MGFLNLHSLTKKAGREAPSWSLLTLHRAGSIFVAGNIQRLFAANGYQTVNLCGVAFSRGIEELDYVKAHALEFATRGRFFGPFRANTAGFVGGIESLRPIVHVRDVRDCIVSNFFSTAYSHKLPKDPKKSEEFLEARLQMQTGQVDQYVEEVIAIDSPFARISHLREICERRSDVVLSRYETMVADFPGWLDDLASAVGLVLPARLRRKLVRRAKFNVAEDRYRHKRQVLPGDFKRKLTPETQALLTEKYRKDLEYFGYKV